MEIAQEPINLHQVTEFADELLPITMDQLRTYLAICQESSSRRGGQLLRREQTSVEKQLRTLQDRFERLAQGRLILKPTQRGGNIELTEAGEEVRRFAEVVLRALVNSTIEIKRLQRDRPIRIALTTFMISVLAEIQPSVMKAFTKVGVKLNRELVHCRSNQILSILQDKEVDFSLGGFVSLAEDKSPVPEGLDFVEWKREGLGLLSSYDLGNGPVRRFDLIEKRIPLIVPRQGLIHDLLNLWFAGEDLDHKLNVVEWCDDVHFGMDLLYQRVYEASMISTNYITKWIKERPESGHLRFYEIADAGCQLRVGLFRRKDLGKAYNRNHPATIFWDVFKQLASENSKRSRVK